MENRTSGTTTESVINDYLESLAPRGKRGPKVTKDSLQKKLERLNSRIESDTISPVRKAVAVQDRMDIERHLSRFDETPRDQGELETEFKAAVVDYSNSHGITWMAWREMGVPSAVLKEAGLPRTRRG